MGGLDGARRSSSLGFGMMLQLCFPRLGLPDGAMVMDAAVSPLRLARRQHQGLDYVRGLLTESNDTMAPMPKGVRERRVVSTSTLPWLLAFLADRFEGATHRSH